ncbi:MAG: AmmeMemoRadiSam system protein A [Candidatus Acidiferrales bacterium]|jgi:AmmeMemoRadiSam system protein A
MSRLSNDDWLALMEIARRAIATAIFDGCLPDLPAYSDTLSEPRGAFVTLYRSGRLRGCVGQVESPGPLAEVVARSAINAALHDPRFSPVTGEEVTTLDIELSVLSSLQPIATDAIIAGEHGLMVMRDRNKGLLLPKVAAERQWSAQRFLEETCVKAGLSRDAWREPGTQVLGFTAEVFSGARIDTIPSA